MGRLFWKFFFIFWLAQVVTFFGVGLAIWTLGPQHQGPHQPPPPPEWQMSHDGGEQPPPPPRPAFPPLMPLAAGSFVSLLFAALLAWYFAQPLRTLHSAFEAVASGRLGTRIGPAMGKRRDELADLGGDFDRMAERLQGLLEAQRRLFHDVSHEMRSPLARLQAAADLMRQQPERAGEFIERIERDTARMDHLVGELLTLARLEADIDDAAREPIDLAELVEEIADDARLEADACNCRIDLPLGTGPNVTANRDLLRRAIENVLRNALHHSPAGGSVAIALLTEAGQARIVIADSGSGLPAADLEAIFEPFFRAANANSFAGYGLGLAITRRVAQLYGGAVKAENRPVGGLAVTLTLPLGNEKVMLPAEPETVSLADGAGGTAEHSR
jgi:signal transduction histidine kinase